MKIERSENPALFLSQKEKKRVVTAVQEAEKMTSGEIRVHLERKFRSDPMPHAKEIFEKLGMTQTQARNGVLILLGVKSHRFVVLGDSGIHEKVSPGFWEEISSGMAEHFREDRFADGLEDAISKIGKKLRAHFPYKRDDINELPDEISISL